jgi:hypothetical protein
VIDPRTVDPGSAAAAAHGCICAAQVPRLVEEDCTCRHLGARAARGTVMHERGCRSLLTRTVWQIEPKCPVHGLAALRAYLDQDGP